MLVCSAGRHGADSRSSPCPRSAPSVSLLAFVPLYPPPRADGSVSARVRVIASGAKDRAAARDVTRR